MRVKPTTTAAKSTRRFAMPPSAMMAPASTKNGTVSIDTLPTPDDSCCITASTGRSIHNAPTSAASASAKAIGMPMAKKKHMLSRRTAMSIYDFLGMAKNRRDLSTVIARSLLATKQSSLHLRLSGLLRRCAPRNDGMVHSSGTWASLPSCGGGPMVRRSMT